MENTNLSVNKKTRPVEREEESSSSSKTPKNENPVGEIINLNRMSEDASVLFNHFPVEIWKLIADKYLDSESLTNLTLASAVFRDLLLTRRVEFLFPQVWNVLGVKFEKQEEEVYSYNIDKMFPRRDLSRFLYGKTPWYSRILTLRLVCKSWCDGVDIFYENLTSYREYKMEVDGVDHYSTRKSRGHWTNTAAFFLFNEKKFLVHFDPTHFYGGEKRNPIFGRFINILVEARDSGILDLLQKYGHHFWFGHLDFSIGVYNQAEFVAFYNRLKEILELLPNLKSLRIIHNRVAKNYDKKTALHPLPKLHQLEFLSVDEVPPCISNALVSANNHISMLEINNWDDDGLFDIYSFPMPNLKQLSMEYRPQTDFENLVNHDVNWALEKFYMLFRCNPPMRRLQIFSLLENKWATALTNVTVTLPPTYSQDCLDAEAMNDDLSLRLNLPNVQRLRVESQHIFSLDFILPMQRLEFLEVGLAKIGLHGNKIEPLRVLEKNQVVQFIGFFGRFHESNIWKLFTNLKRIQFLEADYRRKRTSLDVCTRGNFEKKEETGAAHYLLTSFGKYNLWFFNELY